MFDIDDDDNESHVLFLNSQHYVGIVAYITLRDKRKNMRFVIF